MEAGKNYKWFKDWIIKEGHPCVMAQTVFKMDKVEFHEYNGFGEKKSVDQLLLDLENYISNYDFDSNEFFTFIATFPNETKELTEKEFEEKLWRQLQYLHEADDREWDLRVHSDPENSNFSFSLKGRAFYIVGLHPNSSRKARQTQFPTLVFNLHWQFEKLREMKTYQRVKKRIRRRDQKLQGSINPVLEDFGEKSEANQYSGRYVEENWKCPFHHK